MAEARICDRCGRAYSILSKKFKVEGQVIGRIKLEQPYGTAINNGYDLCDRCAEDLFKWLCEDRKED